MNSRELYLLCTKENGLNESQVASLGRKEQSLLEKREGKFFLKASERAKFSVVLTGGVFDVLHIGHALTLQEARKLGNILIVIVARDATVEKIKGKKPLHEAEYRRAMVSELKPVDLAIVGAEDKLATFARVSPDIVAFGYDQSPFPLPQNCKSVHLSHVKADASLAKTSRIIRELGL